MPVCSMEGSGAEVTAWAGAATGLMSTGLMSAGLFSTDLCSALWPRRIEFRPAGGVEPVVSALIEAVMVSPRPPRVKSQYAKPKPEIAPRKLLAPVLFRSKQGLKNAPLTCEQIAPPFGNSVPGGRRMKRTGPAPCIRTMPKTEPSWKMRPEPVEPSKQVNENSLPATKWRAASAFIGSAAAGTIAAGTATMVNTAAALRIHMPVQLPVNHVRSGHYASRS